MDDLYFLTLGELVDIHRDQIERYGGRSGIRDYDIISAVVGGARQTYGGRYLNSDVFEMAAEYVFYICQDHPFIDGNKRTALAAGLIFLELNGVTIRDEQGILYMTVMKLASGKIGKNEVADILRGL